MRSIDFHPAPQRRLRRLHHVRWLAPAAALCLVACAPSRPPAPPRVPSTPPVQPAPPQAVQPPATAPVARARDWDEFREQAARRIVALNAERAYMGVPPDPLLAIPVLEVELAADGSVLAIKVLRPPRQALDTVQLAIDAVRRSAPFGPVGHLPRPWRFTETFLFDDERRFKPRSLDR